MVDNNTKLVKNKKIIFSETIISLYMFLICKVYDKMPILLDPEIIDYIMKITITDIYREIYKLPEKKIKSWHPRIKFPYKTIYIHINNYVISSGWNFDYVNTLGYVIKIPISYDTYNLNNSNIYVSLLNSKDFRIKIDKIIKIVYINGTNSIKIIRDNSYSLDPDEYIGEFVIPWNDILNNLINFKNYNLHEFNMNVKELNKITSKIYKISNELKKLY